MADAARAGGVRHLVVASVASADRAASVPHFASKREIERHVERVGIAATIVRPSIFMEDLTEKKYVPPASWGMMRKIIGTDRPIPWISARDIGEAVAAIVTARDTWRDRTVTLAGDVRSIGEARAIFERVNGKRPFALAIPNAIFRAFVSRELLAMWEWLARETMDGSVEQTRALVPGALGMEQWLRARSEPRAAQRAAR
ncbi:MAG: NmrA family NAD(P)-binding protein, partial [Sandaracinaceae bacterium]|nr:NmrA family NAD(P)-binding protein [Sandaracinaceae bacterium]